MLQTTIAKLLIIAPLLGAIYIVGNCPCDIIPGCHLTEYYALMGLSIAVVVSQNGLRMATPKTSLEALSAVLGTGGL
jgi:hypothetical protein